MILFISFYPLGSAIFPEHHHCDGHVSQNNSLPRDNLFIQNQQTNPPCQGQTKTACSKHHLKNMVRSEQTE
jgi:hypothetical protein